jgi:hypothetical protein
VPHVFRVAFSLYAGPLIGTLDVCSGRASYASACSTRSVHMIRGRAGLVGFLQKLDFATYETGLDHVARYPEAIT